MKKIPLCSVLTIFMVLLSLCASLSAVEQKKLIVGGKNFTEGYIISEIFAQLIEDKTPIKVERKFGLGGTFICFEALRRGEIDLYPEYTGTALIALMKHETVDEPEKAHSLVKEHFATKGLVILIAVPLGIVMSRFGKLAGPIMHTVNVIQTLPSLALLGFMVPLFGIGIVPAILALFLYALLPIVSNTYAGLKQVDPSLLEAGRAMGMKGYQLLFKVEIPLALNVIMAGVRTSTVLNVGTATLAAFIGAGGLGSFILRGIAMSNNNLILAGAIPVSILAILADRILKGMETTVIPRGMKR
jgi:osmoprotectant transport system permease protein